MLVTVNTIYCNFSNIKQPASLEGTSKTSDGQCLTRLVEWLTADAQITAPLFLAVTVVGPIPVRASQDCWPSGPFCRGFVDPHCSTIDQMIPCHVVESTYLNQSAIVIDYTSLEAQFHIGDIIMVVLVSCSVMSISCLYGVTWTFFLIWVRSFLLWGHHACDSLRP